MSGRVAVVTGAGRGIGRAVAAELALKGCRVIVNYQSSEAAAVSLVDEIKSAGGEAHAIHANVSNAEEVKALFDETTKTYGAAEIVVCNAGITRDNLIMRMKQEDWDAVLSTNLTSVYLCVQAAVRAMMKARFGRIVAISSVSGLVGNAGQANYAAAKAGIIGLVKSVARELANRGITANAIAPGYIETDMTNALPEEVRTAALDKIPVGRYGRPEDIAHAVSFLASDEASYINGQVIAVDGGMTM